MMFLQDYRLQHCKTPFLHQSDVREKLCGWSGYHAGLVAQKGVISGRIQGGPATQKLFVIQNRYDSMVAMKTNTVIYTIARQFDKHRDKSHQHRKVVKLSFVNVDGAHTTMGYTCSTCFATAYQCGCTQSAQHCSSAAVWFR